MGYGVNTDEQSNEKNVVKKFFGIVMALSFGYSFLLLLLLNFSISN
jgi:hypothetical protein